VTSKTTAARFIPLAALIVVLAISPAAIAAKGGHGHDASITFAPTAIAVGQQYRVNGSGFKPNTRVTVGAHFPDMTWWNSGITDGQGNISLTFNATSAGQIFHEAKEMAPNDSFQLKSTATLMVNP
jgi:hypothetical protein